MKKLIIIYTAVIIIIMLILFYFKDEKYTGLITNIITIITVLTGYLLNQLNEIKNIEKIDASYWLYNDKTNILIVVCFQNMSDVNCILEKGTYLLFYDNHNNISYNKSESLKENEILIANSRRNINFVAKNSFQYIEQLEKSGRLSVKVTTQKGTVINLKKGMKLSQYI